MKIQKKGYSSDNGYHEWGKNSQKQADGIQTEIREGNRRTTHSLPEDFWQIDENAILSPPLGAAYAMTMDVFFNARHYVTMDGILGVEHTHSYRAQVNCRSLFLSKDDQIVVGYQEIRDRLVQAVQAYNNCILNHLPPFKALQPTTENLTAILFQQMERMLSGLPVELISLTIWESPTEGITYSHRPDSPNYLSR